MGHTPRLMSAGIVACLLFLLAPATASKCVVGCHGMNPSKAYEEGQTYTYDLEGTSVTAVSEAQGESRLKLNAIVELSIKPDCVRQLKLKNVQVNGAPVALKDVEKHALQFNYHDGHIDTNVCAEDGDSQASLNIKRAVISLFQSAVMQDSGSTSHYEVDVFGGCNSEFTFHKEGETLIVQKYRNLALCNHRETIRHGLITAAFDPVSPLHSSPVLGSEMKTEQRFKNGVLNKAVSTETYDLRPFSTGNAGARTTVETILTFKGKKGGSGGSAPVSKSKSLVFEPPHPVLDSSVAAITKALRAVKEECPESGVKEHAATKFTELVKVLGVSTKNDILTVYHQVKSGAGFDKKSDKKILLDALFRTGSGEAAEVAVELIRNREVSGLESIAYYASLALVRHVNLPTVTAVTSLLEQPDLSRIGYLGIGQIIGKYCEQHECEGVPEVKAALGKILAKVGNGKFNDRESENVAIAALKALGNARYHDDATSAKIAAIAADKKVLNRVRVAAIEALPSSCSMKWKKSLGEVLANREEDSEIRIKSYLSLVKCACPHVANKVKEVLDKETVNQVGSFITTHLRNLRASTDPNKQHAKIQLEQIRPRNKFPEDFRKFSFNNELSGNVGAFGLGATAESNVIYSQNSFVPRSTSLNLTTEMFGHSFNLLELDARVENLDRLIEHYFGPKGEFNSHEIRKLATDGQKSLSDIYEHIKQRLSKSARGRRDVRQDSLNKFAKKVHLGKEAVDGDLDLDLSLKMFGVELAYLDYRAIGIGANPSSFIDQIFDILDKGIHDAKNFDHRIENHLNFLDADLVYPTGLGIPLSVGLSGTSVVHLKASGKIDLPAMIKDPKNAAFQIALEPSAAISIVGNFKLEGLGAEAGLRLVSTLHTSTGSDISIKLLEGNGIDVSFGIPKRKQETITLTSEVLIASGKKGEKYVAPKFSKGKEHSDCFDQLSAILGLTVCGHLSYPYDTIESVQKKPIFPLSGPAKFAISLENNDVTNYHFKAYLDTKNPKSRSLELIFETPNSRNNRRVAFQIDGALEPNKYVKVSLDSPFKKVSGEVLLKNTKEEQSLSITATNDVDNYFLRLGVVVSNGNKYKPILEYKVPVHIEKLANSKTGATKSGGGQVYKVQGDVVVSDWSEGGKKYNLNKVVFVASGRPLASLDGFVASGPNAVQVDAKIAHGEENLSIKLDSKKTDRKVNFDLAVVPSKDPNIGFKVQWHADKTNEHLDHQFVFVYGPDLDSKTNRFTLSNKVEYKKSDQPTSFAPNYKYLTSLESESKVTWPAQELAGEFEIKVSPTKLDTELDLKYGKFKVGYELELKSDKDYNKDFELEFKAHLFESKLGLKAKREKLAEHKNKFSGALELPGGKYEGEAEVTYDVNNKNNVVVLFVGDLKLNGKKIKVDYGVDANPQKANSHATLTIDSTKYLEFLMKIQRGASPHGNLNLNVKNILLVGGQFNYQNGKGSANINVDLPTLHRKIKGTGDMTVTGNKHVANVEVLYDADKTPTKRLKISTDTDLTKESIDSKNIIEILSYKTEVNIKGKGKDNGKNGYQVEGSADVTLPNGHQVALKAIHHLVRDGKRNRLDGAYQINHTPEQGGKTGKILYNTELAWVDGRDYEYVEYIGKHILKLNHYNGKDLKIEVSGSHERLPNSDKRKSEMIVGIEGAYLPQTFRWALTANYNQNEGEWKIMSSLGSNLGVQGAGKYARGSVGKPVTNEAILEFKFPSDKLSSLKYATSHSLLVPEEKDGLFEYSASHAVTYNGNKDIKAELAVRHSGIPDRDHKSDGSAKLALTILKNPPLIISSTYKRDPSAELKKASGALEINYGDKEATLSSDVSFTEDLKTIKLFTKATSPIEKFRQVELTVSRKREQDDKNTYELVLVADKKKYTVNSEFQVNALVKSISIVFTCPEGKTELLSKFHDLGNNVYTGEWKVDSPKGFAAADARVKIESMDSFLIELNFDSDKIKHRKIHAEISTKPPVKGGKRITLTVTSDGKNLVTGSTSYNKRDEAGKIIVEGNGNLKIGENTRTSKFTYSRKQLTREVDGEVGVAIVLNANFGPSAVVGELKLSNKEVHVFNSYCEKSKDCAHFKLQSAFDTDNQNHVDHQLTVEVDLKKFQVPVEFGLRTTTKYLLKEPVLDHTANLYVHTAKDKTQYSSQIYVHPKDSAIILTLPSRELAIISSLEIPKSRSAGAFKVDVSVYLDRKNKPNDKTSFVASGDVNIDKNAAALNGEAKFSYPSQPKEMAVSGKLHYGGEHLLDANLHLDVFAKKTQKIVVIAKLVRANIPKGYNVTGGLEVNSRGQQLKVDLKQHLALSGSELGFGSFLSYTDQHQKPKTIGALFTVNAKEAHILVQAPNKNILKSDTTIQVTKNQQKIDSEYTFLDKPTVVIAFEAANMNSFKYQENVKNDNKNKLTANGRIVLGQLAEIHADVYKNGKKNNLFNALIHLDDSKFLKPDFAYSKDNIVALIDSYRGRGIELAKELKAVSQAVSEEAVTELKDLVQHLKKAQPNLKPLIEYYQAELTKLKNELHADETIKEIQATLNKVFGGLIAAVTETLHQLATQVAELSKQFHEIVEKVGEAIKATYPQLKESFDKIFQAGIEVFDAAVKLGTSYFKAVLNLINEHQKEIKQLLGVAAELAQDVAKIVAKGFHEIEKEFKDFVVQVIEQIKALPIFEFIKEKYAELVDFQIPEAIVAPIEEACNQLRKILPTEELQELFTAVYDYVKKHVRREKVDDPAEIKKIYGRTIEAIQSIIALMQNRNTFDKFFGVYISAIPIDISALKNLPAISALKLSVFNLIQNHELPSPVDVYYAYRPTLHPTDLIPPFSKAGIFLEGGHFFTFDGRHLTMAGSCDYIIAQDMRDGNFSVVANLANGKLTSVTVTAPSESITIKSNGNILANGKPAEYPVSTKNLHAFWTLPVVNVKSDYGIHLMCTPKSPMICTLHVSGFYLGKLRGILGDGNNEAYDDFTLPTGHITEDEAAFGNAYKLNSGCPDAAAVNHKSHQRNPTCTEYFSGSSSLNGCFKYVDPSAYRQACDHATAAGTPKAACLIAGAYWAACHESRVFVNIPASCGTCKVRGDEVAVGDTFSVKLPQKEADIVFVVEQESKNEKVFKELIQPLIADIKNELKHHGITDVHVGLIGYAEHMKWPQHYTTGGNLNIDGDVTNMKFAPSERLLSWEEAKTGELKERLQFLKQRLNVELGTFKLTDAYEEAINYPFRVGAAKAVVGVMSSPCEKSVLPVSLQHLRLLMGQKVYRDLGLTYYQISTLNDILVSGKPQKSVVGYDAESAYTFADSKKKPLEGSSDIRNNLVLADNDVCAGFAVSSGGAAFSASHFLEAKPNQKKQFIQVTSRRLVDGLLNTQLEEDCSCQQRNGIDAHASCKIVGRKEKEPLARHTKGGVKG